MMEVTRSWSLSLSYDWMRLVGYWEEVNHLHVRDVNDGGVDWWLFAKMALIPYPFSFLWPLPCNLMVASYCG